MTPRKRIIAPSDEGVKRSTLAPMVSGEPADFQITRRQDPKLTLYIVGHTDNVGGDDYNMDLSRRRAASVVTALTSQHAVEPKRLKPAGVGRLAPVALNDTEEGRAKNRRVELVKQ